MGRNSTSRTLSIYLYLVLFGGRLLMQCRVELQSLHNSALTPPPETLDPSQGSSLRALPASTQYYHPSRASDSGFGWKTSRERLEKSPSRTLSCISIWSFLVEIAAGSREAAARATSCCGDGPGLPAVRPGRRLARRAAEH